MLFSPATLSRGESSLEFICQAGLRSVGMTWTLHRNMVDKPFRTGKAKALPANRFPHPHRARRAAARFLRPEGSSRYRHAQRRSEGRATGHGRLRFRLAGGGNGHSAIRGPRISRRFWDRAKAKLATIPLDARNETPMETFDREEINAYNLKCACLPADYDPQGHKVEEVESCKISFAGPDGGRVYAGWPSPRDRGRFRPCWYCPAPVSRPGPGRWNMPGMAIWRSISRSTARTSICPSTRRCRAITTDFQFRTDRGLLLLQRPSAGRAGGQLPRIATGCRCQAHRGGGWKPGRAAGHRHRGPRPSHCRRGRLHRELAQLSAPALGGPLQRARQALGFALGSEIHKTGSKSDGMDLTGKPPAADRCGRPLPGLLRPDEFCTGHPLPHVL